MNNETYYVSSLNLQEEMPVKLWETYSDADLKSLSTPGPAGIAPGMMKYVNCHLAKYTGELKNTVLAFGPVFVALLCNRSAGALAQGAFTRWYELGSITVTGGSLTTVTFAAGPTVANESVGDYVTIIDDGGGVGAAPEGETRQIVKNTTTSITVQPAFSVAPANGDTAYVFSCANILAAAIGTTRATASGVVLTPDGIADNYWGWCLLKGRVGLLGKASTAITVNKALISDTGRVNYSANNNQDLIVGRAVVALAADSVSDMFVADIDVMSILQTHS